MTMNETEQDEAVAIRSLSKAQRRVLGVLVEKAFTTPEYYPLTLKAVTTGCNQKSNRHPVTDYSEDDVQDTLEELRTIGLVAAVHTESGRTERYRHYMRRRFTFTEPQLAILTELLLRGRQTLGELRGRASRMVPIDALEQLREEVRGLQELGFIQVSGDLERRGVEIDHALYEPQERRSLESSGSSIQPTAASSGPHPSGASAAESGDSTSAARIADSPTESRLSGLEQTVAELCRENVQLREQLDSLTSTVRVIQGSVDHLRSELGG